MIKTSMMILIAVSAFSVSAMSTPGNIQEDKLTQRSNSAAAILTALENAPDRDIPRALLKRATCVAVIPHVIKAAFGAGGLYGRGLASCRTATVWSMPSFAFMSGGSFGYQVGIGATDLVLVFVRPEAVSDLGSPTFVVGGEAGVAVGPLGREAQVDVDAKTDVYAYSKSEGAYLGIAVKGTSIKPDESANANVYQSSIKASTLLTMPGVNEPATVRNFLAALNLKAPLN